MTEPDDDVLETLRRARPELPDELASPHAPAAQALLEEILSMDTISASGVIDARPDSAEPPDDSGPDDDRRPDRGRRRPRRLAVVGIAAAAVTAFAVATVVTVDSGTHVEAAAQVQAALAETSAAMDSGRAEVVNFAHDDQDGTRRLFSEEIRYSGEDYALNATASDYSETRVVDGEMYHLFDDGDRSYWTHDTHPGTPDEAFVLPSPRTLLEQLEVSGDFEVVGDDEVDGVPTRRLQAVSPEAIPAEAAAFFIPGAFSEGDVALERELTVTGLGLWVSDDGLVRRIELSLSDTILSVPPDVELRDEDREMEWSFSMRFYDFGAPITIEAPTEYVDIPPG